MANGATITLAQDASIMFLGHPAAAWKPVADLPEGLKVAALTGDPINGFVVLGTDGRLYPLDANGACERQNAALPFQNISHLVGDPQTGMLLVSDDQMSMVARNPSDCCSWTMLQPAPIRIKYIAGQVDKGFVACDGGNLLYMLTLTKGVAAWSPLPSSPWFKIAALSGNPVDGVAALVGDGIAVACCSDPQKGPWCLALGPQDEVAQ